MDFVSWYHLYLASAFQIESTWVSALKRQLVSVTAQKVNLFQFLYLFDNQAYCEFVPVKNIYIIIKYWMFYFLWGNFLKIFIIFGRRSKALNVCGLDQDLFPKCVSGHADSFYICRFSVAQVVPEIQAKLDISWVKLISTITKM